jgi:hypothetical protein
MYARRTLMRSQVLRLVFVFELYVSKGYLAIHDGMLQDID